MCAGFGCYCRPKIMKQQPELQWLLALRKDLKCAYCVNFCIYWKSSLMMGGKGQQNCWVYCWYILFCCVHVIACWNSIPTVSQATMMVVHGSQSTVNASASDPEGVVLCNTFKWDKLLFISDRKSSCLCAFHNSKIDFIQQPQEQKTGRRQLQCSNIL